MFQMREVVFFIPAIWLPVPIIVQSIFMEWTNHSVELIAINVAVLGFLVIFEIVKFNSIIDYFINE